MTGGCRHRGQAGGGRAPGVQPGRQRPGSWSARWSWPHPVPVPKGPPDFFLFFFFPPPPPGGGPWGGGGGGAVLMHLMPSSELEVRDQAPDKRGGGVSAGPHVGVWPLWHFRSRNQVCSPCPVACEKRGVAVHALRLSAPPFIPIWPRPSPCLGLVATAAGGTELCRLGLQLILCLPCCRAGVGSGGRAAWCSARITASHNVNCFGAICRIPPRSAYLPMNCPCGGSHASVPRGGGGAGGGGGGAPAQQCGGSSRGSSSRLVDAKRCVELGFLLPHAQRYGQVRALLRAPGWAPGPRWLCAGMVCVALGAPPDP